MKVGIVFAVALALFAPVLRAEEAPFFPLGLWYEGGVGDARDNVLPRDPAKAAEVYERDFADIAAHGINVITIPNSPPDHHKIVLDTAEKHHLKVILELGLDGGPFGHMIRGQRPMDDAAIRAELEKVFTAVKDHPALLRVQLLDEPPGDALGRYGQIAEFVRKFDPKMPSFCCLTGDSNGDKFLAESKSDVVAFDMYPIGPNVKEGDPKPLKDFSIYAQRFVDWAEKHNASSWAVVQCHDITGQLRVPTAGELRCMTYASLATGNRGVFWFLYQSEHVGQALMGGLVDREFKPRPLWEEVAKLSKEIAPLAPLLSKLKPDRDIKATATHGQAWVLRDETGKKYVFAVNMDSEHPQQLDISVFHKVSRNTVTRLPGSEKIEPRRDQGLLKWSQTLPPGGGALYFVD
jgi:hypothetical protein